MLKINGLKLKKQCFALVLVIAIAFGMAACSAPAVSPGISPAGPSDEPADHSVSTDEQIGQGEVTQTSPGTSATLYIGTKANGFKEYPMDYASTLTPELLIQGIAEQTGWDLTLAEVVTTGKGGMSVCLSNQSALFVGPPDPQKDEFHVYDAMQLAEMILDSIQKTLQMGFTGAGGNPDALDIYYYMEGELPMELPDLGLSWPLDQPYQWENATIRVP